MLAKNIDLRNKTVLVTGAAGFIGANLVLELGSLTLLNRKNASQPL